VLKLTPKRDTPFVPAISIPESDLTAYLLTKFDLIRPETGFIAARFNKVSSWLVASLLM